MPKTSTGPATVNSLAAVPVTRPSVLNSMVSPALEFKSEGLITGTAAKLFVVAGPVLVFGISASVIYGFILLLFQVV